MIPDEAAEAGYAAINYLAIGRDEIRAILEAAAPHIKAQALEEAAEFVTSPRASAEGAARGDAVRNWLRKRATRIRAGTWDRSVTW